jgi:hypothetical protein
LSKALWSNCRACARGLEPSGRKTTLLGTPRATNNQKTDIGQNSALNLTTKVDLLPEDVVEALAQCSSQLRQLMPAENSQDDKKNDEQMLRFEQIVSHI